jgi:exonuclease VII small subunit
MSSDLELRRNTLLSELSSINMEIQKKNEVDAATKRVIDTTSALNELKMHLAITYNKYEEAVSLMKAYTQELEWTRISVRNAIKEQKDAIVLLKYLNGK